jgi:nucleotide-binding universal stress UspA family protein
MGNTIVVPLDGSRLGETVLSWATSLARELEASLLLVRVAMNRGPADYISAGVHRRRTPPGWREAELYLEQVRRRLEPEGIDVHTRVRDGLVAENILDIADEDGASLIALATHARRGIARFFLGSVAEGLVHDTRIPLFLVPADAGRHRRPPTLRRILVPLDGSPLSERALEYAADLAGRRPIVLLRVVSPEEIEADMPNTLLVEHEDFSRAEKNARDYLERIAKQLQLAGHQTQVMTARGRPAQEIAIAAHAADADLIVMATHGRTGAARLRLGSIADEVVRHGLLPVLLVSARALAARSASRAGIAPIIGHHPLAFRTGDSIAICLRKMASRRVTEAPVVDDEGRLAGMLSQRDLAAWAQRNWGGDPPFADLLARADEEAIGGLLRQETISVEPSTSLADTMRVLTEEHLDAIPVVQAGQLIGVVTLQDVLGALLTANEAPSIPEIMAGPVQA